MGIKEDIGKRIRDLRSEQEMSQEVLARKAGLDRTYISGVESGKRNISIVNLEKIANALNVHIRELF